MKILVADDYAMIRKGLSLLLAQMFPDAQIIQACDVDDVMVQVDVCKDIDVALIDLRMPGMNGFQGLRKMTLAAPKIAFAILSVSDSVSDIIGAFRNGAKGYVVKSSPDEVLKAAVTLLNCGETYIPPHALSAFGSNNSNANKENSYTDGTPLAYLTRRESEVLALITTGHSNKQIATKLGLKEGSIKKLVGYILTKINATNRTQAAIMAEQTGWMEQNRHLIEDA